MTGIRLLRVRCTECDSWTIEIWATPDGARLIRYRYLTQGKKLRMLPQYAEFTPHPAIDHRPDESPADSWGALSLGQYRPLVWVAVRDDGKRVLIVASRCKCRWHYFNGDEITGFLDSGKRTAKA